MIHAEDTVVGRHGRRRRSVSEKLQIVQLTMEPGASVAEIARAHGVNANQVFKWRRLFERGQLSDGVAAFNLIIYGRFWVITEGTKIHLRRPAGGV